MTAMVILLCIMILIIVSWIVISKIDSYRGYGGISELAKEARSAKYMVNKGVCARGGTHCTMCLVKDECLKECRIVIKRLIDKWLDEEPHEDSQDASV